MAPTVTFFLRQRGDNHTVFSYTSLMLPTCDFYTCFCHLGHKTVRASDAPAFF
jgi:hypothetical protein